MDYKYTIVHVEDHIGHVKFNRPDKSNALNAEAWHELKSAFMEMDSNPQVRVVILSGEGRNFCSGIDVSMLMALGTAEKGQCEARMREDLRQHILFLQSCISSIEKCKKPVIGAIQRACIGGGVDIVTACDMRYCTQDSWFSIREIDMGLVADIGTLQRLPKLIGAGIVNELAFTGRDLKAEEADKIGLVNKTFPTKNDMMSEVEKLAKTIASKSPLVVRGIKETLLYARDHTVDESLQQIAMYNAAFLHSNDIRKSFEAYVTKSAPVFEN